MGEKVFWDAGKPLDAFLCDSSQPTAEAPGRIRILGKYLDGPERDKERTFEEMWCDAVFELYNVASAKDFQQCSAEARAGRLSRREYVVGNLRIESRAAERTRAFYINVFLPWAKEHRLSSNPRCWFVAAREYESKSLLGIALASESDPHWRAYERDYDLRLRVPFLIETGKTDDAIALATQSLGAATTNEEKALAHFHRGCAYHVIGVPPTRPSPTTPRRFGSISSRKHTVHVASPSST